MKVLIVWIVTIAFAAVGVYGDCQGGWISQGGSCYFLHSHDKYDWVEAKIFCDSHNAHLAYIDDQAENDFVKGIIMKNLTNAGGDAHVWLGATDEIQEGTFVWYRIEQPVTFTEWGPGEPNSHQYHIIEDCLVLWQPYGWKWADLDCHDKCYFICEKAIGGDTIIG